MYLNKVFVKHPNICIVSKKELVPAFLAKVIRNQKATAKCY